MINGSKWCFSAIRNTAASFACEGHGHRSADGSEDGHKFSWRRSNWSAETEGSFGRQPSSEAFPQA
jgi:hypothetical protein